MTGIHCVPLVLAFVLVAAGLEFRTSVPFENARVHNGYTLIDLTASADLGPKTADWLWLVRNITLEASLEPRAVFNHLIIRAMQRQSPLCKDYVVAFFSPQQMSIELPPGYLLPLFHGDAWVCEASVSSMNPSTVATNTTGALTLRVEYAEVEAGATHESLVDGYTLAHDATATGSSDSDEQGSSDTGSQDEKGSQDGEDSLGSQDGASSDKEGHVDASSDAHEQAGGNVQPDPRRRQRDSTKPSSPRDSSDKDNAPLIPTAEAIQRSNVRIVGGATYKFVTPAFLSLSHCMSDLRVTADRENPSSEYSAQFSLYEESDFVWFGAYMSADGERLVLSLDSDAPPTFVADFLANATVKATQPIEPAAYQYSNIISLTAKFSDSVSKSVGVMMIYRHVRALSADSGGGGLTTQQHVAIAVMVVGVVLAVGFVVAWAINHSRSRSSFEIMETDRFELDADPEHWPDRVSMNFDRSAL